MIDLKIKKKNLIFIFISLSVFFIFSAILFFFNNQMQNLQIELKALNDKNQKLDEKIVVINQNLNNIAKESEITEKALLTLDQETQAKINLTKQDIIKTSNGLEEKIKANVKESLDSVASKWRKRVVRIACVVETRDGKFLRQGGGTLYQDANRYFLLTNYHVIGYGSGFDCTIQIPDLTDKLPLSIEKRSIDPSGIDYVQIEINKNDLDANFDFMAQKDICQNRSPVGREVLILGYPQTGASEDITVTEGIISAYDNNSYITSAKVDQGNSGGAAIDTISNCYLGMPSFVTPGFLESLARILDIRVVLP